MSDCNKLSRSSLSLPSSGDWGGIKKEGMRCVQRERERESHHPVELVRSRVFFRLHPSNQKGPRGGWGGGGQIQHEMLLGCE